MWLGAGMALGAAGTIWAQREVRRRLGRTAALLSPASAVEVLAPVRDAGSRLRAAIEVGREERSRREAELWSVVEEASGPKPVGRHAPRPAQQRQERRGAVGPRAQGDRRAHR